MTNPPKADDIVGYLLVMPFIILAFLCVVWWFNLESYDQLNGVKYVIVGELEKLFPLKLWSYEWERLGRGVQPGIYRPLSGIERWVPVSLALFDGVTAIAVLVHLSSLSPSEPCPKVPNNESAIRSNSERFPRFPNEPIPAMALARGNAKTVSMTGIGPVPSLVHGEGNGVTDLSLAKAFVYGDAGRTVFDHRDRLAPFHGPSGPVLSCFFHA